MTTKRKVIFESNVNQGHKTKLISVHPIKNWVGIINQNNTFSLWNYEEKILIKSFSCNTLDDSALINHKNSGGGEIKEIIFYDKYSLCSQSTNLSSMKNNIIFVTSTKLFFYDYITDMIKQLTEKEFEQKNIRRVCVYSQNQICVAISDGSFKVIDCKDIYTKNSMTVRTIRGYHTKPITWIFSYGQNSNQMPRVITASAQDGTMACWNVDIILKSNNINQELATPCFKFITNSKFKESSGQQEILSLQHDPSSYRLVTLSNHWIKLWSTMTGLEVKRLKNTSGKNSSILFFSHFSYAPESFIIYSQTSRFGIIRGFNNTIQVNDQIDLKSIFQGASNFNQPLSIKKIKSSPYHPAHLFIITNYNFSVLQLDKFYLAPFGTSSLFLTQLSTLNSKEFITNKAQQQIRKDIKYQQITNIKFEEDILLNTFYLSVDHQWIYFNLVEIQYTTMLNESRRYKLHRLSDLSLLTNIEGGRSSISISFDGKQLIIFNKTLDFYEVFEALNPFTNLGSYEDLLNKTQKQQIIDFYSKFRQLGSGFCREVIWHQYKNQFGIIAGLDQNNKLIQIKASKQKKGIFNKKEGQLKIERSGSPVRYCICVYRYVDNKYVLVHKTDHILSKNYKLYNFGSFYGYSMAKSNYLEVVDFVASDKNSIKEIEGTLHAPEAVYVSYCESCYILSYQKFFIVYKLQQNGNLTYMRTLEFTILHGYFWEKLFFFLTESSLYFLHIINNQTILIKIADVSNSSAIQTPLDIINIQDDDLEPQCKLLPPGHLQIAGLVNMHLMLLNQNYNMTLLISLESFPYIVFCLEVATQTIDKCSALLQKASPSIRKYMKQMIYNYGMVMHMPAQ